MVLKGASFCICVIHLAYGTTNIDYLTIIYIVINEYCRILTTQGVDYRND